MPFKSVKPAKVSDAIVEQIERLILEGILKPGSKLPAERELAQQLDVSRPSLREAILRLEVRGLLQSRRGGGTYVVDVIAPIITDPLVHLLRNHPDATFDILELRHALEEISAYFAALRGTEADCEILQRRFAEWEAVHEEEEYNSFRDAEADVEFHLAIVDASHNVALMHVMRGLFNLLRSSISRSLERLYAHAGNYEIVHSHHKGIMDAILAKDSNAARRAAHAHLSFVEVTLRDLDQASSREERSQRRLDSLRDSAESDPSF